MFLTPICDFLATIGIEVNTANLPDGTFLPGVTIHNGGLQLDRERLLSPGDLLHEAGHLAMLPAAERAANQPLEGDGGMEMAALAWSYAAAVHLELPLEVLFHPGGYKGESQALIENFSEGRYVGVPMLEWAGLTMTGDRAVRAGVEPYPAMRRWLRE